MIRMHEEWRPGRERGPGIRVSSMLVRVDKRSMSARLRPLNTMAGAPKRFQRQRSPVAHTTQSARADGIASIARSVDPAQGGDLPTAGGAEDPGEVTAVGFEPRSFRYQNLSLTP